MSSLTRKERNWILEAIRVQLDSHRLSGERGLIFEGKFDNDYLPKSEREVMRSLYDKIFGSKDKEEVSK